MSLTNPQDVVGWFRVNYSTGKDTAYVGKRIRIFGCMFFYFICLFVGFFDSRVIFVLHVQANTRF